MGALGADAAALERLAGSMRAASRQLADVAIGLDRRVRATGWTGVDAARFERDWSTRHRAALLSLSQRCHRLARDLDGQAAEQRRASAAPVAQLPPSGPFPVLRPVRPADLSAFPPTELRFSGGVGVKVGFVSAGIDADVWLQELPDGRVRVTVAEAAEVGLEATVGATAELTIGGTSETTAPIGVHAGAGAALGSVLRRTWEVDRGEVTGLLARIAAAEAAERAGVPTGDPTRELHLTGHGGTWVARALGGAADSIAERITGIDPGLDDLAGELVTLPAPHRVETLAAVEVAAGAGAGGLHRLAPSGHVGVTGTVRAGRGRAGGTTSTIVEVQGGAAGTLSASLLSRLGVGLPGSVRELTTFRFELVESARGSHPDHLLVRATSRGDTTLDEVLVRVDLEPTPAGAAPGGVRGLVRDLAAGDLDGAVRHLLGPLGDVAPTSVVVTGARGELSGRTVTGGGSLSAVLGAGFSAHGQVLQVDRRG